jgi:predicted ribosome quality control (RQC) complex YloA/Tae2 family protein
VGEAHFEATKSNLKRYNPLWGAIPLAWLQENLPITWEKVLKLEQQLENPTQFYVIDWQQEVYLSLLPLGKILHQADSAVLILQQFSALFLGNYYLKVEKKEAIKSLQQRILATEKYIATTYQKLEEVEQSTQPNEIADILMANLHQIPKGAESITLTNFYRNDEAITISLKRELTAQKNAENYYRKGKNRKKEIQQYYDNLTQKEQLLNALKTHLSYVENCFDIKTLRHYLKQHQLTVSKEKETFIFPFKRCEVAGFEIWIGKSAANNDELTQRYAHKNDMWLHAKDVSGSHVVIKQKSGKTFTKEVIERAAELAAYYSKRKTDTLCPVSYTLKKYVRKPKGAAPGSVIVEKEDVILVQPKGLTT